MTREREKRQWAALPRTPVPTKKIIDHATLPPPPDTVLENSGHSDTMTEAARMSSAAMGRQSFRLRFSPSSHRVNGYEKKIVKLPRIDWISGGVRCHTTMRCHNTGTRIAVW